MQTRQYISKKKKETWIKLTGFSDAAPRLYCTCTTVICLYTEHRGVLKSSFKRVCAFQIELEFRSVGFWGEGKTGVPGKKTSRSKGENQQQTQPTYGVDDGSRTGTTLVGPNFSHHCITLGPQSRLEDQRAKIYKNSNRIVQV